MIRLLIQVQSFTICELRETVWQAATQHTRWQQKWRSEGGGPLLPLIYSTPTLLRLTETEEEMGHRSSACLNNRVSLIKSWESHINCMFLYLGKWEQPVKCKLNIRIKPDFSSFWYDTALCYVIINSLKISILYENQYHCGHYDYNCCSCTWIHP